MEIREAAQLKGCGLTQHSSLGVGRWGRREACLAEIGNCRLAYETGIADAPVTREGCLTGEYRCSTEEERCECH